MKKAAMSLTSLSILFLGFAFVLSDAFAQTGRGAGVPPDALPKELRHLNPRDNFVSSSQNKVGVIHALEGKVVIIHKITKEAYFAVEGDPIFEIDSLNTLADSRCRIRMLDEDLITMAPDTEFSVESFLDQRGEGKKSSVFSMAKGKAMFYAMRLFRYKETRFNLNTPTVTVGVRGTKFGAHVYWTGGEKAERAIQVADAGNELGPYLAQTGGAGRSFTDCHSEDGVLDVGGRLVPPGQMYQGQTGNVIPTPPSVLRSFQQATQMGPGTGGALPGLGEGAPREGQPLVGTGETTPQSFVDVQENVTTLSQVQTGGQTETIEKAKQDTRPPRWGYFTSMLRSSAGNLVGFFQTPYFTMDDFNSNGGFGGHLNASSVGGLEYDGTDPKSDPVITYLRVGGKEVDSGLPATMEFTELGHDDHMSWGRWRQPNAMTHTASGESFYFDRGGAYYVYGNRTTESQMTALASQGITATYSGPAYGTHWMDPPGVRMTGTFSSNANFGTGTLTNINLSVSSPAGNWVNISNAQAKFDGSTSQFIHTAGTGGWIINGVGVGTFHHLYGSFYGPSAQSMGGAWHVKENGSATNAAQGIFVGTRQP